MAGARDLARMTWRAGFAVGGVPDAHRYGGSPMSCRGGTAINGEQRTILTVSYDAP